MKAAHIARYGSPDVLEIREIGRPEIGDNDVLVRVHASVITQGDRRMRAADFPGISAPLGRLVSGISGPRNPVAGTMFAGRVVAVGEAVTRLTPGDDVFGSAMSGAQAEFIGVPADSAVARMPVGMSYSDAAAVPYGATTALLFLRDHAQVKPGQRVLIVGAAGGVGRFAVQIAKHLGAHVTGVCAANDAGLVRELGADAVIDYRTEDFTTRGERYDAIFDTPGAVGLRKVWDSLTPQGRYLTLSLELMVLFQMAITAMFGGRRLIFGVSFGGPADMEQISALAAQGAIRPVVDRAFPLDDVADAHRHLERRTGTGSVVLNVTPPEVAQIAAK